MKIGITGQSGFIGSHLYNYLRLGNEFTQIHFNDSFFQNDELLNQFVKQCDVIIHLAGVNRCNDENELYNTNINLVKKLIKALEVENVTPYLIFASSIQEKLNNAYGKSKSDSCKLFGEWAQNRKAAFSALVIPNIYGPFGKPHYNSFIATFCYKLTHNEIPVINEDNHVSLIYIHNLCQYIIDKIDQYKVSKSLIVEKIEVSAGFEKKVSEILTLLETFKNEYFEQGIIPNLNDANEINLFNTFCCYIDHENYFPRKLNASVDNRGIFVETIKTAIGGQISFSTTKPGITRGEHFHTRKIERFIVVKGKARIQIRRLNTDHVINLYLDGNEPSYVDIPIWFTHNITNIGNEDLYTQFWINEFYNPEDSDTYFEKVANNINS